MGVSQPPAQCFSRSSKRWGQNQLHPQQGLVDVMLAKRMSGSGSCSAVTAVARSSMTTEGWAASDPEFAPPLTHQRTSWSQSGDCARHWTSPNERRTTSESGQALPEAVGAKRSARRAGYIQGRPAPIDIGTEGPNAKRLCWGIAATPYTSRVVYPSGTYLAADSRVREVDVPPPSDAHQPLELPSPRMPDRGTWRAGQLVSPCCRTSVTGGIIPGVVQEAMRSRSSGPLQLPGGQRPTHTRLVLHCPGQTVRSQQLTQPAANPATSSARAGQHAFTPTPKVSPASSHGNSIGHGPTARSHSSGPTSVTLPTPHSRVDGQAARPLTTHHQPLSTHRVQDVRPAGPMQMGLSSAPVGNKLLPLPRPVRQRARGQPSHHGPLLPPILTGFEDT
ncbi:hypothetical protein V8C86DRAFT_2544335 [Haematococcus lacustris]